MRIAACIAIGIVVCATDYAHAPLDQRAYEAAAKACHAERVLPLVRGKLNIIGVSGIRHPNPEFGEIECVRQFLGVAPKDVLVVSGYAGLFEVRPH
jgi:hypothetical protein